MSSLNDMVGVVVFCENLAQFSDLFVSRIRLATHLSYAIKKAVDEADLVHLGRQTRPVEVDTSERLFAVDRGVKLGQATITLVSRNGRRWSFSCSTVNLMLGCCWFR